MATFRQRALNEQNTLVNIGHLEFDICTPEDTRKLSVKEIITPLTFDPLGHPIVGGLYDSALGPMNDKGNPCSTCQGRYSECDGHFGHIELHLPLINPIFHDFIGSILKLTCLKCFSIQIPDVLKVYLPLQMRLLDCGMITEAEELGQITNDLAEGDISIDNIKPEILKVISDFRELCDVLEGDPNHDSSSIVKMRDQLRNKILKFKPKDLKHKHKLCITCKQVCYLGLKYQKKRVSLAHHSKKQEDSKKSLVWNYVNPDESRKYLREIWKRESEFLMVMAPFLKKHKERQYPTDLFYMDVVCVSPPNKRPANMLRGKLVESPKTNTYRELLKNNIILSSVIYVIKYGNEGLDGLTPEAKEVYHIIKGKTALEKLNFTWENMQNNMDCILDADNSKEFVGLKQTIEKKEGLFRMHMQGKRVNFSARSVITPDPLLDIDEIGVPESFALKLTYPTYVNSHNIEELRQMVLNGPLVHPGANSVEFKNCQTVRLDPKNRLQRESIAKRLMTPEEVRNGDYSEQKIVHRHLCNGDIVLMNRQPSLHKSSIMAHKVRILKGPRTLRLHYANCKTYNADFDGDEMNLHFPQTEKARSEAYNLVNVSNQYLVSKDGTPLTGIIQDHVLSGVSLSIRGRFFSKSEFENLVFQGLLKKTCRIKLPGPAVLRPYKMWSGKQVISTIIVNILPNGKKLMNLKSKSKINSKDWQNGPNRMFEDPDELLSESTVMIRNGELLSGVLDKGHLGATPYGLIHCVYQLYGPNIATELLSAFSRLFTVFLQDTGFTLGVQDIVTQAAADEKRKKIEKKIAKAGPTIMRKALNASEDLSNEDLETILLRKLEENPKLTAIIDREYKSKLGELTNQMNNACMSGLVSKFPENNLQLMVTSGAKGTKVNTMQISCCLGQIELEGKRPPRMINGKTLPCFSTSDFSPKAGGYVSQRFMVGITPPEFFFHCMAGREGLIDTAVKTSRSGYLQRCLVKNLEGLRVAQDMTVRDSDGSVIQLFYGGDGMDVGKSQFLDEKHFPFLKDNIDVILDKVFVKSMSKSERVKEVKEYMDNLKQWKEENGTALSKKRYNAFTLFTAFHLSKYGSKITKEELLRIWNEADDDFKQNFIHECQPCPDPVIARYLPQSSFGSISEKLHNSLDKYQCSTKREKKAFENLIKQMGMFALCDSGEPVGLLAAQSIGEPSTQMTLNTFHFAGRGDMNVTLGIPRLQEILMRASKNIKTPSMVIPFQSIENLEYESDELRKKFNKVTVQDVLKGVSITTECTENPDIIQYTFHFKFIEHEHYKKDYCVTPKHIMKHMRKKYFKSMFKSIARLQKKDLFKGNKPSKIKEEDVDNEEDDTSENKPNQESDSSDEEPEDNEDARKTRRYEELHEDGEGSDEDEKSDKEDEELKPTTDIDEDDAELIDADIMKESLTYDKNTHLWCKMVFSVQSKNDFDPNFLVKDTVSKSVIWEVPGINKAITYMRDNVKYLRTDGINIEEVQRYDQILDLNKNYCNDIHMIIEHFGIEAGVNAIMKEIKEVFGLYEIKIDNRHLTLIADFMTKLGSFEALNRMGMESSVSPFQQMSFEASVKSLKRAVLDGKTDKLKNISASLTCGKSSAIETGDFRLMQKFYIPK